MSALFSHLDLSLKRSGTYPFHKSSVSVEKLNAVLGLLDLSSLPCSSRVHLSFLGVLDICCTSKKTHQEVDSKFPLDVGVWMDCRSVQGIFLLHTQRSRDGLWIHGNSDQDKALPEDEGINLFYMDYLLNGIKLFKDALMLQRSYFFATPHRVMKSKWKDALDISWTVNWKCRSNSRKYNLEERNMNTIKG